MTQEPLRFHIPADLRREVTPLLDQQFWLLGCDVKYPQGNLLLELGFERARPPEGLKAATQYQAALSEGRLKLWGFGFWYARQNSSWGVQVRRSEFAPRLCALSEPIWRSEDLPPAHLPTAPDQAAYTWHCLNVVFTWFAEYETFILQRCGKEYRRHCLSQWTKRRVGSAEDLSERWRELAKECLHLSLHFRKITVA